MEQEVFFSVARCTNPPLALAGVARLACASILKPLYAWVCAQGPDDPRLVPMVRFSDNEATTSMVTEVGGVEAALKRVAGATGVQWSAAATWGGVCVTALEVATAYTAFRYAAQDGHPTARAAFETMQTVDVPQRLGLDTAWAETFGGLALEPPLAIKCGWYVYSDLVMRTHAVILTEDDGMVALTGIPIAQDERDGWAAEYDKDPSKALVIHRRHADPLLREAIRLTRRSD